MSEFRRRDADRFVDQRLAEGVQPATVNRGVAVLRHMLTIAVEREYLERYPLSKFRMLPEVERVLQILTYDEYRRLINAVAADDPVIGAFVAVLGETGLRRSEGLRLEWQHVRLRGENPMVIVDGQAKSGKVRTVPLSYLAINWLQSLVRFVDVPQVFVDPLRGKRWKDRGARFIGDEQPLACRGSASTVYATFEPRSG